MRQASYKTIGVSQGSSWLCAIYETSERLVRRTPVAVPRQSLRQASGRRIVRSLWKGMIMNRAARKRANKRRRLIEAGQVTKGIAWGILNSWQREAEHRGRIAFEGGAAHKSSQTAQAVWALYRAKLEEARQLEECCPEVPVVEELAEYCRRAIARHTESATMHRTFMIGPGVARARANARAIDGSS